MCIEVTSGPKSIHGGNSTSTSLDTVDELMDSIAKGTLVSRAPLGEQSRAKYCTFINILYVNPEQIQNNPVYFYC